LSRKINKAFALLLTLTITLACVAFFTVKPASAQSIPTLSVPQFIAQFVPSFTEVPATTTTNPFTGQNETSPSYFVDHSYIQLTIQNQPSNGNTIYYNVRMKGHFADNWLNIYDPINGEGENDPVNGAGGQIYPVQAGINSTVIIYTFNLYNDGDWIIGNYPPIDLAYLPNNSQFDFQVQAETGTFAKVAKGLALGYSYVFTAQSASGWSDTQTVTVNPTTPTPTPTVPASPVETLNQDNFTIQSNSTITAYAFNSQNQELSFNVSGTSCNTGYTSVTFPKSFLSNIDNLKVTIDGKPVNYQAVSSDTAWTITINYHLSTHQIKIDFNSANPSFLGITLAGLIGAVAVITVVCVIVYRFKHKPVKTAKSS
jgi:hypothetical protein